MLEIMKRAARDVINESKPVAVVQGTVISASPLKVKIDQKLTLTEDDLILCANVTDHEEKMRINGEIVTVQVKNALKANESVIMIRSDGGQLYLILDRVVGE
ncbi:MAG: DUF2577 domain-containing protein [Raoultibacter sp.]